MQSSRDQWATDMYSTSTLLLIIHRNEKTATHASVNQFRKKKIKSLINTFVDPSFIRAIPLLLSYIQI